MPLNARGRDGLGYEERLPCTMVIPEQEGGNVVRRWRRGYPSQLVNFGVDKDSFENFLEMFEEYIKVLPPRSFLTFLFLTQMLTLSPSILEFITCRGRECCGAGLWDRCWRSDEGGYGKGSRGH